MDVIQHSDAYMHACILADGESDNGGDQNATSFYFLDIQKVKMTLS
jgi:hypothetical protein